MTAAQQAGNVVLMDSAGNYYVLTPELLAQARVPDERRKEIERLLDQQSDTAGFSTKKPKKPWLTTQAGNLGISFGLLAQNVFTPSFSDPHAPDEEDPSDE